MILHVYKELADGLDMVEVANLVVGTASGASYCLAERFSKNDLPMKSMFACKATQTV